MLFSHFSTGLDSFKVELFFFYWTKYYLNVIRILNHLIAFSNILFTNLISMFIIFTFFFSFCPILI